MITVRNLALLFTVSCCLAQIEDLSENSRARKQGCVDNGNDDEWCDVIHAFDSHSEKQPEVKNIEAVVDKLQ